MSSPCQPHFVVCISHIGGGFVCFLFFGCFYISIDALLPTVKKVYVVSQIL